MMRDKVFLQHILEAIENIESDTENISPEQFYADRKTKDAVVRNFEIIGEAIENLSEDIRMKYPEIPWTKPISLRNRAIHEYFGVNYTVIWETIKNDLPPFKEQIKSLLEKIQWKQKTVMIAPIIILNVMSTTISLALVHKL